MYMYIWIYGHMVMCECVCMCMCMCMCLCFDMKRGRKCQDPTDGEVILRKATSGKTLVESPYETEVETVKHASAKGTKDQSNHSTACYATLHIPHTTTDTTPRPPPRTPHHGHNTSTDTTPWPKRAGEREAEKERESE